MNFIDLLKLMKHKHASDLFITAGVPPSIKVDGKIMPVTKQALTPEQSRAFAYGIMNEDQRRQFEAHNECNFAIAPQEIGRSPAERSRNCIRYSPRTAGADPRS